MKVEAGAAVTGRQALEQNPYRAAAEPHVVVGFLAEHGSGPSGYDPLVLPARSPEGRWATDVWAPLEGRAFNGGLRWEF